MAMNALTERLRTLPARREDTWQGSVVQLPTRIRGDDGKLFVPSLCLWVSKATGRIGFDGPDAAFTPGGVAQAMLNFATSRAAGYRPGKLEVMDADQAAALSEVVAPLGITVDVVDRLPAVDHVTADLLRSVPGLAGGDGPADDWPPALLDDPAVTPARVAAFAQAAKAFYEAAPWRHFGPTDLITVVAPKVAKPLRFINVMGGGGEQFGLAFFPSQSAFIKMLEGDPGKYAAKNAMVSVTFDAGEMVPPGDVEAWRTHGWPAAKRGRKPFYPFPATFDRGTWTRPTAAELATMEGLLRAVTRVTPANLATEAWSVHVNTADGEVQYEFTASLAANDALRGAGRRGLLGGLLGKVLGWDQAEAERLVDAAWDAGDSPRAIDLAARAISVDPDAADAYVILGNAAPTPATAVEFFRQGVAAGERKLGAKFIQKNTGMFWGMMETRPYMRAMAGLANTLHELGQTDDAVATWQRMLELNPNDNQGMRDLLAIGLLHLGRDAELEALLRKYKGDGGIVFMYARALLQFRTKGDGPEAVEALGRAIGVHPHMVPYLTGAKRPPRNLPATYQVGDKSEADAFAEVLAPAWRATPRAVDWLKVHAPVKRAAKRSTPKSPKGRPRGMWLPPGSKPPTDL